MVTGKYTVIVMRDDADVRRFKAGPGLMRFFCYLMVLLLLAAAGGAFTAYKLWQANGALAEEKRAVELKLAGVNIKLERLQNIERILSSNDPSELKTLLSTIAPETQAKAAADKVQDKNLDKDADKEAVKDEPDKGQAVKSPFDGLTKVDAGVAGVENITMRFDAKGMVLGFGLKNINPQTSISGNVHLALITQSGQLIDLATKEELGFQIQRFKQMTATAAFPGSLDKKDVAGLRLTINNTTGKTIFSDIYTISQN